MSELTASGGEFEPLDMQLELFASEDYYARIAVDEYRALRHHHQTEGELADFLRLRPPTEDGPVLVGQTLSGGRFNEAAVQFVLRGTSNDENPTDYSRRAGFVCALKEHTNNSKRYTSAELTALYEKYKSDGTAIFGKQDLPALVTSAFTDPGLEHAAKKFFAVDLDETYDSVGCRRSFESDVSYEMARMFVARNKPELAEAFAKQITGAEQKLNLLREAAKADNAAGFVLMKFYGNLESEFQDDGVAYAMLLLLHAEYPQLSVRSIDEISEAITLLTSDSRYFDQRRGIRRPPINKRGEVPSMYGYYQACPESLRVHLAKVFFVRQEFAAARRILSTTREPVVFSRDQADSDFYDHYDFIELDAIKKIRRLTREERKEYKSYNAMPQQDGATNISARKGRGDSSTLIRIAPNVEKRHVHTFDPTGVSWQEERLESLINGTIEAPAEIKFYAAMSLAKITAGRGTKYEPSFDSYGRISADIEMLSTSIADGSLGESYDILSQSRLRQTLAARAAEIKRNIEAIPDITKRQQLSEMLGALIADSEIQ